MPPRARQSTAAPSTNARQSLGQELPPYQAPSHPLNAAARLALSNLAREYSTKRIETKFQHAGHILGESVADVNERLYDLEKTQKTRLKRRAKDAAADAEDDDDGEAEYLEQTRARIDKMTVAMEKSTRKAIDGFAYISALEAALAHIATAATASANATQATQASNTQRSMRGTAATDGDDDDDDVPASTAALAPPTALTPAFETALQSRVERYQATSHHHRYATHGAYVNFKQLLHDAQDPEGAGPALAHCNKWFTLAQGAPEPGVTAAAGEDDSDDDIAIAGQKISTKCPITFLEFKDPVTSTKCPHSYERYAIEDMIAQIRPPTVAGGPQRRGEQAPVGWRPTITCPVAGCDHVIGKEDVRPDPVLVRRIKRIQRAREMRAENGEEEEGAGGDEVEEIESDSGDDVDDVAARMGVRGKTPAQVARIKREAASRRGTGRVVEEDIED